MNPAELMTPIVSDETHVCIRGVRLRLDDLIDERQLSRENALRQHEILKNAAPFEHAVFKDLFNDRLLELIREEFDLVSDKPLGKVVTSYEDTRRSQPGARLGPAAQLYFWLVNSAKVTDFLGAVSGVADLIPDPRLLGGGLHETRNGGRFAVHRDFETHFTNGLSNAMVFITYLNKDWSPSFNGSLELWDADRGRCVTAVAPEFGVSLMLCHGPRSYHGYDRPLNMPDGRTRRSVANYFYTNLGTPAERPDDKISKFLFRRKVDVAVRALRPFVPPILWSGLRNLKR